MTWRLLAFLTRPYMLLGLLAVFPLGRGLWMQWRTLQFETVPGVVVSAKVEKLEDEDSTRYAPVLTYRYQVAGQNFTDDKIHFGAFNFARASQAERYLQLHPPGSKIDVHYDPADPARSQVGPPGLSQADLVRLAIVSMLLSAGLASVVIWFRDRRYAGGFPFRRTGSRLELHLKHTSPLLALIGYLPLASLAALAVARLARMDTLGPREMKILAIPFLLTLGVGWLRTALTNRQEAGRLVVEPGHFTLAGPKRPLGKVVLEQETFDTENGHSCWHLRLRGKDGVLGERLVEMQSSARANRLAAAIAEIAGVDRELQASSGDDGLETLRSAILAGVKLPEYRAANTSPAEVEELSRQLQAAGFEVLNRLSCANGGVLVLGRQGQCAEISHVPGKGSWVNLRSRLKSGTGETSNLVVSNCGFRTQMPRPPVLASKQKPQAGLDWVLQEHTQLLERARRRGWTALPVTASSYTDMEAEMLEFYRQSIERFSSSELTEFAARMKVAPILDVTGLEETGEPEFLSAG